jgi:hypothetical protein
MSSRTSTLLRAVSSFGLGSFGCLAALAACGDSGQTFPAAQIEAVTPNRGPSTGGTMLRITGSGFIEGDIVSIGGQLAPGSQLVSPTEIAVPLPANAGAFGPAPVGVTHRDGTMASRSDLFTYYLGSLQLASRSASVGQGRPFTVRVGDLNADGVPDALTGNFAEGRISVLLGVSGGGFLPPRNFAAGQPVDTALADFNGDGRLDVLIADLGGRRLIFLPGDGQGGFGTGSLSAVSGSPLSLAVGDA